LNNKTIEWFGNIRQGIKRELKIDAKLLPWALNSIENIMH
jgi:hypothetical protein